MRQLQTLFLYLTLTLSQMALASLPANSQDNQPGLVRHIIEIKGIEIPELLGKSFNEVSLFSVRNGMLLPIPFQLEDFDEEGYSWFAESDTPLRGREAIIDEHDSLLLQFSSAGDPLPVHNLASSRITAEIKLFDQTGAARYVYAAQQLGRFEHAPLTHFDQRTGRISSEYFTLDTNPENFLIWNDFTYRDYKGDAEGTLLDTLKIRLDAGVLLDKARITLDNRNIKTNVVAVKQGPIRTVVLANCYLTFASVPIVDLDIRLEVMPQQFQIDAKVDIPPILASLLRNPTATVSLDGANLKGSILRTAEGPEQPVLVDGRMSEQELELRKNGISRDKNWIWLSTQAGFDVLARMQVPANFQVPVSLHYIDNDNQKDNPERFVGQGPNVGYYLEHIPVNEVFHFSFQAYFTDSIAGMSPGEFVSHVASVPYVASHTLQETQQLALKQDASARRAR